MNLIAKSLSSGPVRVSAIFSGPISPELTADTKISYMVYSVRLVEAVVFLLWFTLTNVSLFRPSNRG